MTITPFWTWTKRNNTCLPSTSIFYPLHNPDEGLKGATIFHLTFSSLTLSCLPSRMACSSFAARAWSLRAALPGAPQPAGGTTGCCQQQRLLKDDGLNSIVVAEVVLLRCYHSGKHTWKRFKQIQAQKAEQDIGSKTIPIRKSPAMPCLLINTEPATMSFALKSYRGGMACLPARLAKVIA